MIDELLEALRSRPDVGTVLAHPSVLPTFPQIMGLPIIRYPHASEGLVYFLPRGWGQLNPSSQDQLRDYFERRYGLEPRTETRAERAADMYRRVYGSFAVDAGAAQLTAESMQRAVNRMQRESMERLNTESFEAHNADPTPIPRPGQMVPLDRGPRLHYVAGMPSPTGGNATFTRDGKRRNIIDSEMAKELRRIANLPLPHREPRPEADFQDAARYMVQMGQSAVHLRADANTGEGFVGLNAQHIWIDDELQSEVSE